MAIVAAGMPVGLEPAAELDQGSLTALAEGLRMLHDRGELCDLVLSCGDQRFQVHKAIMAAMSSNFRACLRSAGTGEGKDNLMEGLLALPSAAPAAAAPAPDAASGAEPAAAATTGDAAPAAAAPAAAAEPEKPAQPAEFQVLGLSAPEAVQIMVSYIYSVGLGMEFSYEPSSSEVNKDVLKLAAAGHFALPHLQEHAARWLAKGLTTTNVVERLVTCEQFSLGLLREKIMDKLTANPVELTQVSASPEIMQHPRILQDLLCRLAAGAKTAQAPKPVSEPEPAKEVAKAPEAASPAEPAEPEEKKEEEKVAEEPAEEQEEEPEPKPEKKRKEKHQEPPAKATKASAKEKPAAKKARRGAAGA